jgi:hypothetical protein
MLFEDETMLPIEKGRGQIWHRDRFLCDIDYEIDEPQHFSDGFPVQRITLTLPEDRAQLLDAYDLSLVIADGRRYAIPRPIRRVNAGQMECYVESLA